MKDFSLVAITRYKNGVLYQKRTQWGLSQKEMSKKIGISNVTYSSYERMATYPCKKILKKMCKVFNTNSEQLFPQWLKLEEVKNRPGINEKYLEINKMSFGATEVLQLTTGLESVENILDIEFVHKEIFNKLDTIAPREKKVLIWRFGLEDGKPQKLEDVAKKLGVTRERIRQIEAKAIRKLKNPTRAKSLRKLMYAI